MTSEKSEGKGKLDIAEIRKRLGESKGRALWRSLDELAESDQFLEFLNQEFPRQASLAKAINRRDFLKIVGASLAFGGLTACTPRAAERILPYQRAPEQLVPGLPLSFATAYTFNGYARGVLARSDMGRPTKTDGNPRHPSSLGASDPFMQASILGLYDPDRAQAVTNQGNTSTWEDFLSAFNQTLTGATSQQGTGLRILTETITSPTFGEQMRVLLEQYPQARWHQYDPAGRDQVRLGAVQAFGEVVETVYHFDQARVVLSLDCDIFFREPGSIRYMRDFSNGRRVSADQTEMNRLYVVESTLTTTGATADHRLALAASQVETFARAVANRLGVQGGTIDESNLPGAGWLDGLVSDLEANAGASLIIAGDHQPPVVHALAHAMNQALNNVGTTVTYLDPVEPQPMDQMASLRELVDDLLGGRVSVLVIVGGNPAYAAPADLEFSAALEQAPFSVYLGLYQDETAAQSTWHIPATHYLEMWGDARAHDGTASIIQPLVEPLYGGKSPYEFLAVLLGQANTPGYDIVRQYWQSQLGTTEFEPSWKRALSDGIIAGTELPTRQVNLGGNFEGTGTGPATDQTLELVFAPDPSIWDGRYANNAWLQELPKPITKLTWDNAAMISASLAESLGITNEDVVELSYQGRSVEAPAWILPGQPDNTVTIHLGYGRTQGGRVQNENGFNAYLLRTSDAPWFGTGLEILPTGRRYNLASTQVHQTMDGRHLVQVADIEDFRSDPNFIHTEEAAAGEPPASLYPEFPYEGHAWGMAIDLNVCMGCNACVISCQSENNIPVVGKEEVLNSREMHWLRIDDYFEGEVENPEVHFQPVLCMHCEKAPCEPVCPVGATTHSAEGINEMTYNRCVGTRYCSNNCPYKVRRFNFYDYVDDGVLPLRSQRNPDVTVRSRGVMEKCTYCVQRINRARIREKIDGTPIEDGQLQTACQQACPANAIIFGDINDQNSLVRQLKEQPQNYGLLEELGTQPRTSYLARFRNPNPNIQEQG